MDSCCCFQCCEVGKCLSTHSYHAHIYKTLINIHTQTHRTFSSLITIALFFVLYRAEPLRRDAIFLGGVPPARCFVSAEPLNTRHANCTHEPWLCGVHAHTYRRPCPGQGILYVSACNLWVSVCLDMLIRHTHTHKHTYKHIQYGWQAYLHRLMLPCTE